MPLTAEEATRRYAEKEFKVDLLHARVDIENHEGYKCCTGSPDDDPSCYCSFAESDWQTYNLVGYKLDGSVVYKEIGDRYTSFNEILGKILVIGNADYDRNEN